MVGQVSVDQSVGKEFLLTDENFHLIKKKAYSLTGIALSDHKKNMIYGRLVRRLRVLKFNSFDQYCELIQQKDSPELPDFVNAITTNLTSFFRELHHFEFLNNTLLPSIYRESSRRIRIWSAGCSTGEEPYSIAMTVKSVINDKSWDIKILATDLDSNVVATGKEGIYREERIESIPKEYNQFFVPSGEPGSIKVKDDIRNLISFKRLNLLGNWPMKGPFDFIFCRNVVIYFDLDTQKTLFDRYASLLKPNGHLFIGHSESLHNVSERFEPLGKTIYKIIK